MTAPVFHPELTAGLPEPARRYLRHALASGTPLAASVRLQTVFRMVLTPGAGRPTELVGQEVLEPPRRFVWTARPRGWMAAVRVRDEYADGRGSVRLTLFGLLPVGGAGGPDVSRSARHRLAIESIWLPSSLLPGEAVAWHPLDDTRARVTVTIDGESIPLTVRVDDAGRLAEVVMLRHGNAGVRTWQPIPYGVQAARFTRAGRSE